nr:putative reverse transcriptase domain-containing protein [Tanacetum cinerariifolium]
MVLENKKCVDADYEIHPTPNLTPQQTAPHPIDVENDDDAALYISNQNSKFPSFKSLSEYSQESNFINRWENDPETTKKIMQINERLKTAQDRQKSYADKRRKPLEFKVGDRVLLKVSPWKGAVQFGKKGKLAPWYVGPFKMVERVGTVAYWFRLPQELSCVHDTFHVSNFKKCLADTDFEVGFPLSRFIGILVEELSLCGSVKISSRPSTRIFSPPPLLQSSVELWGPELP